MGVGHIQVNIRKALDSDIDVIVNFSLKLSAFNRDNHDEKCKYDDYEKVQVAIKENIKETFIKRDSNTLFLDSELNGKPLGYALVRLFEGNNRSDDGTGRMRLLDEIFVDDLARRMG